MHNLWKSAYLLKAASATDVMIRSDREAIFRVFTFDVYEVQADRSGWFSWAVQDWAKKKICLKHTVVYKLRHTIVILLAASIFIVHKLYYPLWM